jgi:putative membrane protein
LFLLIPLFWIGVFVLLFTLLRRRQQAWGGYGYGPPWRGASRSAESTLGERFANGDIDETEYRARLEVLRANAFPQPRSK